MSYQYIVTIFTVLTRTVCAQDEPLSLHFVQSGTIYTRVGDQLNVTCEVNRPIVFLMDNDIDILIRSVRGELLLSQGLRRVGLDPKYYHLGFDIAPQNGLQIHFIVPSVTSMYDGKLICRAKTHLAQGRRVLGEDAIDIVIMTPLESFRLYFDLAEPITESMDDPVKVDSGYHAVTCIAEGSNPPADVHLYLDGRNVPGAETKSEKMIASLTQFRTTLNASVVIWKSNFTHKLKCVVATRIGDERSVQLQVRIKTHKPTINCSKSVAYEGQKNVVLSCMVDYSDLDDVTGFRYSLGSKEYNSEGNHNDEFVQVSMEQLSHTKVRVRLKLTEVKGWHCENEFYVMVFHRNGCIIRQSVRLSRGSGTSTILSSPSTTVVMTLFLLWLVKHAG